MTEANNLRKSEQKSQNGRQKEVIPLPIGGAIIKSNCLTVDSQSKKEERFRSPIRVQVSGQPNDTEIQVHVINPHLQSHLRRRKRNNDLRAPIRVVIKSESKNTEVHLHATKVGIQAKITKGIPQNDSRTQTADNTVKDGKSEVLC